MIFPTRLQEDTVMATGMGLNEDFDTKEEVRKWLSNGLVNPRSPAQFLFGVEDCYGHQSLFMLPPDSNKLTLGGLQLKEIFHNPFKARAWQKEGKDVSNKKV